MKEKFIESIVKKIANLQSAVTTMNVNIDKIKSQEIKAIYAERRDATSAYAAAFQTIVEKYK